MMRLELTHEDVGKILGSMSLDEINDRMERKPDKWNVAYLDEDGFSLRWMGD